MHKDIAKIKSGLLITKMNMVNATMELNKHDRQNDNNKLVLSKIYIQDSIRRLKLLLIAVNREIQGMKVEK